jgi:hypothetical protein
VLNSSRLTWFLKLQRTFQFPRYSLAPFRNLPRFHGKGVDHAGTANSVASEARTTAGMPQRAVVARSDAPSGIFRSKPNIAAQDYLPGRRSVSPPSRLIKGPVPLGAASSRYTAYRTLRGKPESDMMTVRIFNRIGSPMEQPASLPHLFEISQRSSTVLPQLASRDRSSELRGQMAPIARIAVNQSIGRGYTGTNQVASAEMLTALGSVSEGAHVRLASEEPELGIPGQSMRQPERRPSASTLHIDGAALGRWTVQHLARTLGKPTPGMTGVDPRAGLPRSRIQPF